MNDQANDTNCRCKTCGRTDQARHEWENCRCKTCGKIAEDDSLHLLRDCKCTRCGKQFEHRWKDVFSSYCETTTCERHNCSVVGNVNVITRIGPNGAIIRDATVTFTPKPVPSAQPSKDGGNDSTDPLEPTCIDPNDSTWVYQYRDAPNTIRKLSQVPREVVIRKIGLAINSTNRKTAHVAAFVLTSHYLDLITTLSARQKQKLARRLAEMGMKMPQTADTDSTV